MKQEDIEQLEDAIEIVMNSCNIMGSDELVADALANVITKQHRTIQQSFFRSFNMFLQDYSKEGYDGRNEESVKFAKRVTELDHYFPFV